MKVLGDNVRLFSVYDYKIDKLLLDSAKKVDEARMKKS